jgi:hypothetical protein
MLRRSRRQVYRYLRSGELRAAGKLLGEWLLERGDVVRLARSPLAVQPVPSRLQPLFPEYDTSSLNAGRDRALALSRVLELGGLGEARWAFRRYSRKEIAAFLRADGARMLSPRALRLWSLYLGVRPRTVPSWRRASPWSDR